MSKRMMPSLTSLRAFEAVARHQSLSKAAEELNVTPAAVSHQIRTLSAQLEVTLLQRVEGRISLTQQGNDLFNAVSLSFDHISEATQAITQQQTRAKLSVRVTRMFSAFWLAPRLAEFLENHPTVDVVLHHRGSPIDGDLSDYDVVIGHGTPDDWRKLVTFSLGNLKHEPFCSPRLLKKFNGSLQFRDMLDCLLIHETFHDWWTEWFALAGLSSTGMEKRLFTDDFGFAVEACMAGNAVILESAAFLTQQVEAGQLIAPFQGKVVVKKKYYMMYDKYKEQRKDVIDFCTWLQGVVKSESI